MEAQMFWKDGLCFECQRCLYCCSTEPGYVLLSDNDIENCRKELGMERDEFISVFCRYVDYGNYYLISLKEKDNYDCIFLTKNGCKIYEGRPLQCRTYPFWPSIMEGKKSWEEEGKSCPGINKGKKISPSEIESILKSNDNNPPYIVLKKNKNRK